MASKSHRVVKLFGATVSDARRQCEKFGSLTGIFVNQAAKLCDAILSSWERGGAPSRGSVFALSAEISNYRAIKRVLTAAIIDSTVATADGNNLSYCLARLVTKCVFITCASTLAGAC